MKDRFQLNCMAYFKGQYHYGSKDVMEPLPDEVLRTITSTPDFHFPLPTQYVVRKAQIVMPLMGRVWMHRHLGMFDVGDNCQMSKHTYLIETWVDNGDDGHTSYTLSGYVEVSEEDARKYVREMEEGKDYPPQVMLGEEWIA